MWRNHTETKVTQVDERNVPIDDATEMKGEGGEGLINQKENES
jgi:hypothetical protein